MQTVLLRDIEEDGRMPEECDEEPIEPEILSEPPAGYEDMLYEEWRDEQYFKNDKPDPDRNAASV